MALPVEVAIWVVTYGGSARGSGQAVAAAMVKRALPCIAGFRTDRFCAGSVLARKRAADQGRIYHRFTIAGMAALKSR
jgi:hypothetical protein